ncbi:hypothetical protein A2995_02000 [Candidatus Nomurabacteria bacterium RIFCSPLOWO2_01_FULL_33_24]|uniref:FAD/NAD(P)-binding domain-containing protein n=1 Tax=Candidatus Nomurabacteria bacterium RIFCSPLOWO2_01_FULL_33_24 TaxID=1801765 RepID=A0A1F6WZL1_9BACT|nr:MAG: hypothetical protein A2995_02000 [Candidatus Nomurabacteria bacterium RIFCSPLOWO2_01_FULL_33_24]
MLYDLIIIGGGPAGSAAAVYAGRKHLKSLMLVYEFGGQSIVSEDIQNWIGTVSLSGQELAKNFKKHVETYSKDFVVIKEGEKAIKIEKDKDIFKIKTDQNNEYVTKTILITTGSNRRKLKIEGAKKFENKGITYCASCDGPMFAEKDVAVIGGGNAGFETAVQLLAYAKSVTLLDIEENYKADKITIDKVLANPKMTGISNAEIIKINGDQFVTGLIYKNKKIGEEKTLKVEGIFVEIGQIPNTETVKNLLELDEYNRIKIDFKNQKTSLEGIWSAGDCTNVLYHQNNIAAGDGVRALEDIYLYLHAK